MNFMSATHDDYQEQRLSDLRKRITELEDENASLKAKLAAVKEILEEAQGEWVGVTKTYSPEWTIPFKHALSRIESDKPLDID